MTQLRTCDGCARHVFVKEKQCPFCGAQLAPAAVRSFGDRLRSGLSRAQRVAIAAALAAPALGACSDDGGGGAGTGGAGGTAGSGGTSGMQAGVGGEAGGGEGGAAGTQQ